MFAAQPEPGAVDERLGPLGRRLLVLKVLGGALFLALALYFGWAEGDGLRRFYRACFIGYCFCLSLSLGALFFVMLQHLTRAGWSVVVRRPAELLAGNLVFWTLPGLLFVIPAGLGNAALFPWADVAWTAADPALSAKQWYLNPGFFAIRGACYFAVWGILGRYFLSRSLEQDRTGDPALTRRMERASAVGMVLFGVTVTFAAFDFLMSLDPRWSSTIFGVYFFSGCVVGFLAQLIIICCYLRWSGRLAAFTAEHSHDLGKLLFAFVFFWGYVAFSQFMLIWYANLPEETTWYARRMNGAWGWVSLALLFGHFLLPFTALLSRQAKRRLEVLFFWAVWLLLMHGVDIYWLIMPNFTPAGAAWPGVELLALLGMASFYAAGALNLGRDCSLVPMKDPRSEESKRFENY